MTVKRFLQPLALILLLLTFSSALAQDTVTITALGNVVHRDAVTAEGAAGVEDISDELAEATGVTINWETVPWPEAQERTVRELSLASSDFSLVYVISEWMSPQVKSQLMPLNSFMESAPIENFEGIPGGMLSFVSDEDGNIYGIPVRAYGPVLFYNTEIMEQHGYDAPPQTFEELYEMVQAVAGRREDGARVYGIRFEPGTVIDWARAYGGDGITTDFQIRFTEPEMIRAINEARAMYEAGVIPQDFMNMVADDWLTLEQNGQVAFSMRGPTYFNNLNNAETSSVAGKIGVTTVPASETIDEDLVPGNVSFWSMTIPANAANPEAAWEVIRYLSSDAGALAMAVNGNAPTKTAVYDDPAFAEAAGPWLEPARASLAVARPDWPAFDEQARAVDIFEEQVVLAITGQKTAEEAMADAAEQIQPLLPQAGE